MPNNNRENEQGGRSGTQGGTHEQHVKAGQQSHKNDGNKQSGGGQRGGSHEQHVKAGQQSHKNDDKR